ncbi:MAG: propionate CoA-transferase [Oscillospiraceae bacterium]|nr:propionate CoA-transferase [Oscillospiraceae bacterium]
MPRFLSAAEAVALIRDGDCLIYNNFLGLNNCEQLSAALNERFKASGHPRDLTIYCTAGLGGWTPGSVCEEIVLLGAVKTLILSHYSSMPETARMVLENKVEAYNLPFGVMSHAIRAAAAGQPYVISDVGLNLFVDPKYKGYQLNEKARRELVREITIDGKRRLLYETPQADVALIKASSCDALGNISMEDEPIVGDALSIAQAVHRRGGKVIVQVRRMREEARLPVEVVIPAALVDYICICPEQTQIQGIPGYDPRYSGQQSMSDAELEAFVRANAKEGGKDLAKQLIARRAAKELQPGQVVNIGVGAPEFVAVEAGKTGLLSQVALTVEAGSMKGLPAGGVSFGASMGAQSVCTTAEQFDLYDGGGLNICFIGALEIDGAGNVNGHYHPKKLSGIGGFINITQFTHKVVFCATFSAGGLEIAETEQGLQILHEGRFPKFVEKTASLSFSAENAHASGQEVVYVTERCVFRLGPKGLVLTEIARGVDLERDILRLLPFEVEVAEDLKVY